MGEEQKHTASHDDVCWALGKEAYDWKIEALRALHATYAAHANGIKEVPPKWKSAAAFNFCIGAVEKLFPTSLGAGLIARAAVPIWLYTEAVKAYDEMYKNRARDANALLTPIHTSFVRSFANAVDMAETGLVDSAYGRAIARQMQQAVAHRQFEDKNDARTHLRISIDKSKIVDDDPATHAKRFEAALGKMMDKVSRVYAGTWEAPGRNALFLLRLNDSACGSDAQRWHLFQRRLKVDDIDVHAEKGRYSQELSALVGRFNGKVDCAIPIETIANGNIGMHTSGKRALQIIANIDKYEVIREPADVRFGTGVTTVWAKEKRNFSIHTVANTFNNSLPAEAIKAFTDAERKIWNTRPA